MDKDCFGPYGDEAAAETEFLAGRMGRSMVSLTGLHFSMIYIGAVHLGMLFGSWHKVLVRDVYEKPNV